MLSDKLTNKTIVETMDDTNDTLLAIIGGLVKRINPTNLAAVMAPLITAAQSFAVRTVTASSDTPSASDRILNANAASNTINFNVSPTLFFDATAGTAKPLWINRIAGSANDVTITPTSGTIDGAATKTISAGGKMVYSDGTNLFTL